MKKLLKPVTKSRAIRNFSYLAAALFLPLHPVFVFAGIIAFMAFSYSWAVYGIKQPKNKVFTGINFPKFLFEDIKNIYNLPKNYS